MKKEKIVLAYSGGLDTSVAIPWLKEKRKAEVIALLVDLGQRKDLRVIRDKALKIGARKAYLIDAREEFVRGFIYPSLKAGAVYEGKYFLATALGRPLIAQKMVRIARENKASFVAHGATGKGNDQVRFELSLMALAPDLEVIAPLRQWKLTRDEAMSYAAKRKIPIDTTKKSPYSLDENLWGVSIECGSLEDPKTAPPREAYLWTAEPREAPDIPDRVIIEFRKGVPVKLDKKLSSPVEIIQKLNALGGKHGLGRTDLVENRLIGIKSREIYEAPAAFILHHAHRCLEELTLDRQTFHFKELAAHKYAELVYDGMWFTPLREALDSFVDKTQEKVNGQVTLELYKGNVKILGRESSSSLYQKSLATYDRGDEFDQDLAEGFIKLWGLPLKIQGQIRMKENAKGRKK